MCIFCVLKAKRNVYTNVAQLRYWKIPLYTMGEKTKKNIFVFYYSSIFYTLTFHRKVCVFITKFLKILSGNFAEVKVEEVFISVWITPGLRMKFGINVPVWEVFLTKKLHSELAGVVEESKAATEWLGSTVILFITKNRKQFESFYRGWCNFRLSLWFQTWGLKLYAGHGVQGLRCPDGLGL